MRLVWEVRQRWVRHLGVGQLLQYLGDGRFKLSIATLTPQIWVEFDLDIRRSAF
ncbi:MAG: hypothetical protein JST51_10495 [Armatimonadetes bacterium]|nr:hypothetical protein [Armatimonadota bacterium]